MAFSKTNRRNRYPLRKKEKKEGHSNIVNKRRWLFYSKQTSKFVQQRISAACTYHSLPLNIPSRIPSLAIIPPHTTPPRTNRSVFRRCYGQNQEAYGQEAICVQERAQNMACVSVQDLFADCLSINLEERSITKAAN
jgi:hypothetical protein